MAAYSHFKRLAGILGLWVGSKGNEVQVADESGNLYQSGTQITAAAAEINALNGAPMDASFTIGAEAGNVINVAVQLKDAAGADLAVRGSVFAYLSTDAEGDNLAASAPDGGWAIGTNGVLIEMISGKAAQLVSSATGDIDINITHAVGAGTWYLVVVLPNGKLKVSGAITFAA